MHLYAFFFSGEAASVAAPAATGGGGGGGKSSSQRRKMRFIYEPEEVREVVKTVRKQKRLPETLNPGDVVEVAQRVAALSSVGQWDLNAAIRDLRSLELAAPVMYRPMVAAIRGAVEDDEEALLLLI